MCLSRGMLFLGLLRKRARHTGVRGTGHGCLWMSFLRHRGRVEQHVSQGASAIDPSRGEYREGVYPNYSSALPASLHFQASMNEFRTSRSGMGEAQSARILEPPNARSRACGPLISLGIGPMGHHLAKRLGESNRLRCSTVSSSPSRAN